MTEVGGIRRSLVALTAVLAAGLGVAGCSGTDQNAMTQANYTSADGVQGDSGTVGVRNLLIVSDGRGGTISGAFASYGTDSDSVVSITANGAKATITAGASLAISPGNSVTFGLPTGRGGPQAYLTGTFSPGGLVPVTVVFADASALNLQVPVLPRTGYLTAVPTPTAAGTPAATTPAATPAATPTATPAA